MLRLGYPYENEHFRIVEIRSTDFKAVFRLFYVSPSVKVGEIVEKGGLIGYAQDISARYRDPRKGKMINHIHIELILDPDVVFKRQEI